MTTDDEERALRMVQLSRIDGEFEGWRFGALFPLESGVVWQQIGLKLCCRLLLRPQARVFQREDRFWLQVQGMDEIVAVQRFNPLLPVIGTKRQQAIHKRLRAAHKRTGRRRSFRYYFQDLVESCKPDC